MPDPPPQPGKVYLVGAGPGDPGLLTVRGVECLGRADLVLYDYLVNPAILDYIPPRAEALCLGRHGNRGPRMMPQGEVHATMIRAAREGRTVVRLKGGDPDVFGRGAEETEALRDAGIAYETVPGVTAALAAAAYAGIPVTHGDHCSAVALVTARERSTKTGPPLDYGALAEFPGTLVFYMGVTSAEGWSGALLERGKPADTPAMIVRRTTWTDQATYPCTLGTVAEVIARHKLRPPAVIVVGDVVRLAPQTAWFAARPLFGTRIVVTRPKEQSAGIRRKLVELGADVLVQPAICISDPPDWDRVDEALGRLDQYDWLVFSSSNGVRYLLERLLEKGRDLRSLGKAKLAAIGPGTAEELARYRLRADLVPDEYRAEALADALAEQAPAARFLLLRASRGREVLAERLTASGASVDQVVVYSSTDVDQPDPPVAEALERGEVDWVTVTSSAIARSLVRLFGDQLRKTKLASISPITSGVLRELGYPPTVEASEYTMDGLIEAILRAGS